MTDKPAGEAMVMVPRDDDKRAFSDSLLPAAMIEAGGDAVDRVDFDLRNYVSGQTIDWDSGMIAVAVYRAMIAAHTPPQAGNIERDTNLVAMVLAYQAAVRFGVKDKTRYMNAMSNSFIVQAADMLVEMDIHQLETDNALDK